MHAIFKSFWNGKFTYLRKISLKFARYAELLSKLNNIYIWKLLLSRSGIFYDILYYCSYGTKASFRLRNDISLHAFESRKQIRCVWRYPLFIPLLLSKVSCSFGEIKVFSLYLSYWGYSVSLYKHCLQTTNYHFETDSSIFSSESFLDKSYILYRCLVLPC